MTLKNLNRQLKNCLILVRLLANYIHDHDILQIFDTLPNFTFASSEMNRAH